MSELIIGQACLFLVSLLYGGVLGLWYDFFRAVRKRVIHENRMVHVEDVIFCFTAAGGLFLLFQIYNQGSVRFYVLLGTFVGTMLYFLLFSYFTERIFGFLLEGLLMCIRIFHLFIIPLKLIVNSSLKSLKKKVRTARIIKSRK